MKAILLNDIYSIFKSKGCVVKYANSGETVSIIHNSINAFVVEDTKGNRFPVNIQSIKFL